MLCCVALGTQIVGQSNAQVKGNRAPHEAKKKSFDLGGNQTHDLRIRSTGAAAIPVLCGTTFICTLTFSSP